MRTKGTGRFLGRGKGGVWGGEGGKGVFEKGLPPSPPQKDGQMEFDAFNLSLRRKFGWGNFKRKWPYFAF
jgi:hypothetical protein